LNEYRYTFYVDGDVYENLAYHEYLGKPKLMALVTDYNRRRLFLGTTIYSYDHDYLLAHQDTKNEYEFLYQDAKLNKLKYFCPNSKEQLAFINDDEHDVVSLIAGNRIGKTTCGVVKTVTSGIIPLDPTWPIFTKHGVKFRPWLGKERELKFAFGSYEWSHAKSVIWPRIKEYVPDQLLGVYASDSRKKKDPNFERQPMVELSCGTMLKFHAYSQSQANFESDAYNGFMYDEQPPENIFNAIDERTRTLRGRHIFTLTPHKVDGMPGTGGGGWLQKFLTGEEKRGHNISSYNTSLGDVPDWIYPESEKIKAFQKWIHEPTRNRNMKVLREGRSRILGEWHKTSGLVIDDWDRAVHVVDDFKVPAEWTRYRAVDHGTQNPTACLWLAVSPPKGDFGSDIVVYREYYSQGKTINENVAEMIKLSGNVRRRIGAHGSDSECIRSGVTMTAYEEVYTEEVYAKTVLDSRSFASTDANTGKPYGQLYKSCGLQCSPASGKNSQHWVPILKELFIPKLDECHVYNKGVNQRPKLMVFRSCHNLIREIEGWIWEEYRSGGDYKNLKESPRKLQDHGCTALAYACQIPLRWRGDINKTAQLIDGEYTNPYKQENDDGEYRGV